MEKNLRFYLSVNRNLIEVLFSPLHRFDLIWRTLLGTMEEVMNMKNILLGILKFFLLGCLVLSCIFVVHFMFVLGVDSAKDDALYEQCLAYAKQANVELVKPLNAFTYQGNVSHATCVVLDLYEKIVFVDPELHVLVERNFRSYQTIPGFDGKQSQIMLSMYQEKPIYIAKNITKDTLLIEYYAFDTLEKLVTLQGEE